MVWEILQFSGAELRITFVLFVSSIVVIFIYLSLVRQFCRAMRLPAEVERPEPQLLLPAGLRQDRRVQEEGARVPAEALHLQEALIHELSTFWPNRLSAEDLKNSILAWLFFI